MKLLPLLVCLALCGCQRKHTETPFVMTTNMSHQVEANNPYDSLTNFLRIIQVWKCDNGGYEVRIDQVVQGRYATLEEAEAEHMRWAKSALEASKRPASELINPPTCGTLVPWDIGLEHFTNSTP